LEGGIAGYTMLFGERRLHERKTCTRTVRVIASKGAFAAHLRDLALGGAMIEPPSEIKPKIGEELIMTIPYGLKQDELTLRARIAWIQRHGIGVQFVKKKSDYVP
jgi:Tfp pilus assembly protein PilZ